MTFEIVDRSTQSHSHLEEVDAIVYCHTREFVRELRAAVAFLGYRGVLNLSTPLCRQER